ncbi:MAG: DUF3592 domain-containing protein [Chloroflexota bacterium]
MQNETVRCDYCGSSIQTIQEDSAQEPQLPPLIEEKSQTPLEWGGLKRPKVQQPLGNSGFMLVLELVFALVWTLFSAIFPVVGVGFYINETNDYRQLSQEGVIVPGIVLEMQIDESSDPTSYDVDYQFTAPVNGDSTRFADSESVSAGYFNTLQVGQQIQVRYAASNPQLSVLEAEFGPPSLVLPIVFGGIGGLFVLIGLVILVSSISGIFYINALRLRGQQTKGIIFDRWQDTDSDGDTTCFVAYCFHADTPKGEQLITRAEQNRDLYQRCEIGNSVIVRYLPGNPRVCHMRSDS